MTAAEHQETIARWRERRAERLRGPTGWLSLIDRVALEEGENQLPIGIITLRGGVATLHPRDGVSRSGEALAGPVALEAHDGGASDALTLAGLRYELFRRGDHFAVRVKDPRALALVRFAGIEAWAADLAWRIEARWEPLQPPRQTVLDYDLGAGLPRTVPGLVHFEVAGRPLTLEPVLEEESRRLFFVFADETNRDETYPGGRFLYAPLPEGDRLVLDFNTAFNPPCAFTPFASCPRPPAHNRLPVRIAAGEKRYERER